MTRSPSIPPAAVDALRRTVDGLVAYPTDPAYDVVTSVHPALPVPPDVVVVPATEAAVRAAVDVARTQGLRLSGRATGPEPVILVLTHLLDDVVVDPDARTATVGPGATWTTLATHAERAGLVAGPHDSPTTGTDDTVAASARAGTTEVLAARVVRADGFVHVIDDPRPPPGETGPWFVTAVLVPLHPLPVPTHLSTDHAPSPTTERIPS